MSALAWVGGVLLALGTIAFIAAAIWFIYNTNNARPTGWYVWVLMGLGVFLFLLGLGLVLAHVLKNRKKKKEDEQEESSSD